MGATTAESAPKGGQLIGASVIIRGTVTKFAPKSKGGGISLGRLLEAGGVLERVPALLELAGGSPAVQLGVFVVASALMSALMSNTATAALLIPLASVAYPMPSTAILIAMACSFGMPFVISTPPNAIVHGQAGVTAADLMWVGLPIMILGCAVLIATGPAVLAWIGFG